MSEKVLPYNRVHVPQETGWWCGPAAVQTTLQSRGKLIPERDIASAIEQIENPGRGDDKDGTDYIGLIETYLDRTVPEARYTSVYMPNDPPTQAQKDRLWRNLVQSIDAGWGVVANIVAPPWNPPAATKDSVPPPYPRGITTFHYIALMGYDDNPNNRAVWVADSAAFGGITGWWCPFDGKGSICQLIPPKGYCYADVVAPNPDPKPEQPQQVTDFARTDIEWRALLGETAALSQVISAARRDSRGRAALALVEQVNPAALQSYLATTKG